MTTINYTAPASLYLGRDWHTALSQGARTFSSAAKAIRFAVEEAAPVSLRGALLIVDGQTYSPLEFQGLYGEDVYPLTRKSEIDAAIVEPEEE